MKKYIVALCLITAGAALLMQGSRWALVFWFIGFLSTIVALILLVISQQQT